ncbi:MAG TPA: DedA family protein [Burkholderiales bacterium]|nr:DedA family protein [Burkholderiales bacterium]
MSFEQLVLYLIENYGYLTILIWTFIEGETIVILAGMAVASSIGGLELGWVIASALAGSFSGDQFYYYLGRHWGPKIIAKRLSWQASAERVYKHLHRHQYWLILTFRFYYGLRNVTPFAVGASQIPRVRFFVLNLIGAIVWAVVFAGGGYLLGETLKLFMDDYHRYALYVLGTLMLGAVLFWIVTVMQLRRKARELKPGDQGRAPPQL